VSGSLETNYDFVYYESEYNNGGTVLLDNVIVGISKFANASIYYEVFNWENNVRDRNTNVDTDILPPDPSPLCLTPECDNREIPMSYLYAGTGILIDVDNALSAPPVGNYQYIVIISPPGSADGAQVDSIEVTEVPR